jgi:hypothetical protein
MCFVDDNDGREKTVKIFPDAHGRAKMEIEGDEGGIRVEAEIQEGRVRVVLTGPEADYLLEVYGAEGTGKLTVNGEEITAHDTGCGFVAGRYRKGG